jgi:hypothetical protein
MLFIFLFSLVLSCEYDYHCLIRIHEDTDETIVLDFYCPHQDLNSCNEWFNQIEGTIQYCYVFIKEDCKNERIPYFYS